MPDKVLTASPEDPEPIVTPKPVLFMQFDPKWQKVLLRPTMIVENGAARDRTAEEQLQVSAEASNGDRWGASGCHPTSLAMVVEWLRRHPKLGADLKLPFPPDAEEAGRADPRFIWKWLRDSRATPDDPYTATSHPAWTPHHRANAKDTQWSVNHAEVTAAPKSIKRNGVAMAVHTKSWKRRGANEAADLQLRADRKKTLKQMLLKCGPLPINMTYPGHYVLLYGYRGNHLYILDPGKVIEKWAMTHPDWPKVAKEIKDKSGKVIRTDMVPKPSPNVKLVDSKTSGVVAQFFSNGCDLLIDGEFEFQEIALGKDKAGKVTRGPMAFLDCIINYEGFDFPKEPPFDEFLTAPAPGSDGAVIKPLPPPAVPPAGPPANGTTDGSAPGATTGGTPSSGTSSGSSNGASAPSGGFFSDLWDVLLHTLDAASGAADGIFGSGGPTTSGGKAGDAPAGATTSPAKVRASVTVIDDDTEKPLAGVEVEIVGIDKGKTDAKGVWASRTFDAATYHLKTRKAGYGPGGSEHATSEGETAQAVGFQANQSLTVRMRNVNLARGFLWVLEEKSRRPLADIGAEIVGIDAGRTDADGKWVSKSFAPNKKWVKTRAPGWGPAAKGAATEGETAQQVDFGKGDKTLVVYMSRSSPLVIPPPAGARKDPSQLKVSGPEEIDATSFAKSGQTVTFKADPTPGGVHPLSEWTAYGASGNAVDTNHEPFGSTYDLASSLVQACVAKRRSDAYGRWTIRFERGSYYDDFPFVLVGPMPDVGAVKENETPSADSGPVPEGFVADGYNPDKITKVNAVDMAHAYADALQQSGAAPTRKTVLLLTAHWDFETGGGKAMHWYNLGNVKYVDANGKVAFTRFKCDEWLTQDQIDALEKSAPEDQYEVTEKTRTDKKGVVTTRIFLIPPHPGTRFRAYPNLSVGLAAHLKIIRGKKFGKAFDAAVAENVEDFVHQLKVAGYFTDSEEVYKKGVQARYAKLDKLITDLVL
ncbi:MAG TPA: hypothetical protein VK540_25620 [Polyangiaceae bacterium]|nr:hypothetical protein [Polyangiaceae bacterium]